MSHGLPHLQKVARLFDQTDVAVVGLHTVFEHHDSMTPVSLAAFLHEYHIGFPVGVDRGGARGNPMPQTMSAYEVRGTPTMILIDRSGMILHHYFEQVDDLQLGAAIMALVTDSNRATESSP